MQLYVNGVLDGASKGRAAPLSIRSPARLWIGGWDDNYDFVDDYLAWSFMSKLLCYNSSNYDVLPGVAERWDMSADGKVYTFYLYKNIKFHDGTPFNAEAVEFNYMRHIDKAHPYYDANLIGGGIFLANVKSVKAKAEFVVEFVRDRMPIYGQYLVTRCQPHLSH
jgi:ABC-type transport system substrate-binding protein